MSVARTFRTLRHSLFVAALAAGLPLFVGVAVAQPVQPKEIMTRNFQATRFETSTFVASMEVGKAGETPRTRSIEGATKLMEAGAANAQIVRFKAPSDLSGTATLTINRQNADDDLWVYLPSLKKVRRLVSSNKRDSYIGSEFSFGDILGFEVDEWNHRLLPDVVLDGEACWVVESTPSTAKTKQDYGYSKRISWVRKSNFVTMRGDYYDLAGELLKRILMEKVKAFVGSDARYQPMTISVENLQTGRLSAIRFSSFEVGVKVADADVTAAALDR